MADAFDVIPFEVCTSKLGHSPVCIMPSSPGYQGGLEETGIRFLWERLQGFVCVSYYLFDAHRHRRLVPGDRRGHQGGTSLEQL